MKKINPQMPIRYICALAMMSAISVIAGKYLQIPIGNTFRFSFENTPIIFTAMSFGPIYAMLVGIVADLVGCLLVGYEINPLVTVGAAAIGLISGITYKILEKASALPRIILTVAIGHLIGSVVIKTLGLAIFYTMPIPMLMLYRLFNYLVVGAFECALLFILQKNKGINHIIRQIKRKDAKAKK